MLCRSSLCSLTRTLHSRRQLLSFARSCSAKLRKGHPFTCAKYSTVLPFFAMENLLAEGNSEALHVGTVTITTPEESSTTTAPTAEEEQKPPPRVYDLYSWRDRAPNGVLYYVRDPVGLEEKLAELQPGPVGFDCEWKPTFAKGARENPVALVQLASGDTVLLIQLSAMRTFPPCLRDFLQNPAFIKAGVGIQHDCKKLWNDYCVRTRNCVDLSLFARTVDNAQWKGKYTNPLGLARLCEAYHELTLNKGRVQRSNWEAVLSPQQQEYAANDCHSGLTLYQKLHSMSETMDPLPLPVWYSFDYWDGYLWQPSTVAPPEILWHPHNPIYDPGPLPPPRPPKDKKDRKNKKPKEQNIMQPRGNSMGIEGTAAQAEGSRPSMRPQQAILVPTVTNVVPPNPAGYQHQQQRGYHHQARGRGGRHNHRPPQTHQPPGHQEFPSNGQSSTDGPPRPQGNPRRWRPRRGSAPRGTPS